MGWALHGLLRFVLIVALLPYAWSKVFLVQMGLVDYPDALYAVGEKSPMGLLWTFMAYSPAVQVLSGLAELAVALLLVFRRTAWLGGLLGTVALGVVFLLNLTYDVPVRGLALALTVGLLLVAVPELPRVGRFVAGRATGGHRAAPALLPWPRVRAVTRWLVPVLGLLLVLVPGAGFALVAGLPQQSSSALPGVYRVVADPSAPAPALAADRRWQEVAFGQWVGAGGRSGLTIRLANGDLVEGRYRPVRDGVVAVEVYPVLAGDRSLIREVQRGFELTWTARPDGTVAVRGDGQDLVLEPDPELRYLLDRGFSWSPGIPINR